MKLFVSHSVSQGRYRFFGLRLNNKIVKTVLLYTFTVLPEITCIKDLIFLYVRLSVYLLFV